MPLYFNNNVVRSVPYNGLELEKIYFNNVLVFERLPETWTGTVRCYYNKQTKKCPSGFRTIWDSKSSETAVETGTVYCTRTAQEPIEVAVFKVDTSKYKFLDITPQQAMNTFYIYSSLSPDLPLGAASEDSYQWSNTRKTDPVYNIDLTPYEGKWIAVLVGSLTVENGQGKYINTVALHN